MNVCVCVDVWGVTVSHTPTHSRINSLTISSFFSLSFLVCVSRDLKITSNCSKDLNVSVGYERLKPKDRLSGLLFTCNSTKKAKAEGKKCHTQTIMNTNAYKTEK
jgi:hypothetical protein